jgi:succinate-semialdehyde dehydrogenase/glutarate-semialdehyde dehydrogenase
VGDVAGARFGETVVVSEEAATGRELKRIAVTEPREIARVMERAREAQGEWGRRSIYLRARLLEKLREVIYRRREEIAAMVSAETGKPRAESILAEVMLALDTVEFFARRAPEWLRKEAVPHHNLAVNAKRGWMQFEPYGVVAVISPWNYPFAILVSAIAPALVAGNAVVLKPSELTPQTGELIGELFGEAAAEVGAPRELLQIVQGGGEVGAALIAAGPAKVFFTGSVATGKLVAGMCAERLIPSVLELGGKDAMIVLKDANLEVASSGAVWGAFTNCGQACLSVTRIYVQEEVAERFVQLVVEKARKLRLGGPGNSEAEIGPMIRESQVLKIERQLREAVEDGAEVKCGGKRRPDLGPTFFEPTVSVVRDENARIMREETFGPVVAVASFAGVDDAVKMANATEYGLSASVWTRDTREGERVASRLRAGSVMVNDVGSYYGICEAPHGGSGASGWGRTHSRLGLLETVRVKYVDVDGLPGVRKPWWFGYGGRFAEASEALTQVLFARGWRARVSALRVAGRAMGVVFRGNKI